jgi:hypothetical protein
MSRFAIGAMLLSLLALAMRADAALPEGPAERVVAIGDLHGDYEAYWEIVQRAGLVNSAGRWSGGRATLVQTGDIADRGPDSLRIYRHLRALQLQAARAGGRVIVLVGNHEAMNMTGDLRYVHAGEYAAFVDRQSERRRAQFFDANRDRIMSDYRAEDPTLTGIRIRSLWMEETPLGWVEHRLAWHPEGELGRWMIRNPAAAVVADTLFVHGGISPAYAALSLEDINRRTSEALEARDLRGSSIINDPDGPLWYRGLVMVRCPREAQAASDGRATCPAPEEQVEEILGAYGVRRIAVGHTPSPRGIALHHGGRLIQIDTGIAAAYGGARAYLEIVDGQAIPRLLREAVSAQPAAGDHE